MECEAARRHGLGRARQRVRATKGLNDRDKKIGRRSSKCGKGNAEAATRRRGGRKKGWNKTKPAPVEDTSGRHKWKTQVEDTSGRHKCSTAPAQAQPAPLGPVSGTARPAAGCTAGTRPAGTRLAGCSVGRLAGRAASVRPVFPVRESELQGGSRRRSRRRSSMRRSTTRTRTRTTRTTRMTRMRGCREG